MEKVIDIRKSPEDTSHKNYTKEGKRYESDNEDCILLTSKLSLSTAPTYQSIPVLPIMTPPKESKSVFSASIYKNQHLKLY